MSTIRTQSCIGAVVIGRNEGERLRTCLHSLVGQVESLVYVDSGSTDNSLQIADEFGVTVINLDLAIPFTAARARNEGFNALMKKKLNIDFVQFVDGDCEVSAGWVDAAMQCMRENNRLAVVCGRRRERYPERSIYNLLCDIEWDTPLGEAMACGGDALIRAEALLQVDAYDATLIAGEEPEMCLRLRREGWKVARIDAEMTWHDADMMRFSQWWKRALRAGHAYAEGAWMHGSTPEQHWVREVRSNWFWGLSFIALVLIAAVWPIAAWLLMIYPVQMIRIYHHSCLHRSRSERRLFACFCVLAKLPLMLGQIKFHLSRMSGNKSRLIEYK